MTEIILGSAVFMAIMLMPSAAVTIRLNGGREIKAQSGRKLLSALTEGGLSLPAACGGAGSWGQCRVQVVEGGTLAMPTETAILSRRDIQVGIRLACQTTLRHDISLDLPASMLEAKSWVCTVASSRTVAPMIREIVLDLPVGTEFTFEPGAFVMIEAPPYAQRYANYAIAPEHRAAWDSMGLNALTVASKHPQSRAYSIANSASDVGRRIVLLIRLAVPPPDRPKAPPGLVSSWLFGLAAGDSVAVSGPFGSFAAQKTDREMVFIGGGVGMAPLKAILFNQLVRKATPRKISFWYGARSRVDLLYETESQRLQADHANFNWTVALSDPAPVDGWKGETDFIHEVALRTYLGTHPAPHGCEYCLCGPPLMIRAVLAMLDDLGVDPAQIFHDDFRC